MSDTSDVTEAARKALEAFYHHAKTQHKLFRTIPIKPRALGRGMIEFDVTLPELFADGDAIHGGLYTILLDTTLAAAAWTRMDTFQPLATINLKTDFFGEARAGEKLRLTAHCQSISNDVAFCQGTASTIDGTPVAQADGTFIVGTSSPAVKGSRL